MHTAQKCRNCGAEIAADAPFGHCPQCLIGLGFASKPSELPPGSEFVRRSGNGLGDYELISQIGRGGMGVVFRAQQKSLGRVVALKMIRDEQVVSPVFLKRFQIEAEAAASLDHPHIVPIYEVGEEQGQRFYSMRLMEGGNLEQRITSNGFVPPLNGSLGERARQERIARFIATAARAMHYAHKKGVVHRDLKPSNILLDEDDQPHLSDFGIAKLRDGHAKLTITGALLGTPSYMAPEQAQGETHLLSAAVDIYSLGAILYEMLTGKPPFSGVTPVETLHRLTNEDPKKPTTLNRAVERDLENICLKCLEKNPLQRYSSAEGLAEDLERWLRHEPTRARRAGPVLRTRRWIRRNPVGTALIATLFVGFAISLALLNVASRARVQAEQNRKVLLLQMDVDEFWKSDAPSTTIRSEAMALLKARDVRSAPGRPTVRYKIAMLVEDKPMNRADRFADFLLYVEDRVSRATQRNLRLDYVMYKRNKEAIDDLVNHKVDFLRIGGLSYLDAYSRDSNIIVIASQSPPKTGVIFTRAESTITNVSDLDGKTFAFGDSYATISFWARYHLASAGIGAQNLSGYQLLETAAAYEEALRRGEQYLGQNEHLHSHFEALKSVLDGRYDAGVSSERQARSAIARSNLRPLKYFQSTSLFFLAASHLPNGDVQAVRSAMLELQDRVVLEHMGGTKTKLTDVPTGELDALRESVESVVNAFPDTRNLPKYVRDPDANDEEDK